MYGYKVDFAKFLDNAKFLDKESIKWDHIVIDGQILEIGREIGLSDIDNDNKESVEENIAEDLSGDQDFHEVDNPSQVDSGEIPADISTSGDLDNNHSTSAECFEC